ncbi:MAG: hypothetical protein A2Y67_03760 [Candidatus Buchananbacteria bacterium RBG_13_39_9]|uniref:Uncharacterized protein n=1 Tax=Candidatus Buchananbacteria bacterium RBG_13_39_9 TaxID=1797531 RepID=A0A1G1XRW0_9BACT|nr:MAG: hypothetical protein A2Y67_03760 [Candidatus Buchananbacteria bacterium RBG_13_39_9]
MLFLYLNPFYSRLKKKSRANRQRVFRFESLTKLIKSVKLDHKLMGSLPFRGRQIQTMGKREEAMEYVLYYWKNGKKVQLDGIYDQGRVGQVVILANVSYGENPDLGKRPLAAYPQPTFFVIKVVGRDDADVHFYTLVDPDCKEVLCGNSDWSNLYDAREWGEWQKQHHEEKMKRKDGRIAHLESQVDLLRSILIQQGVKLITPEQAEVIRGLFGKKE